MSSQSVVLLIMGVAGSGKTLLGTMLSKKLGFTYVDADDYHPPENKEKMRNGTPLTDEDRFPWLLTIRKIIEAWLANQKNGIVACSALKASYRDILMVDPERVIIIFLTGSQDLIAERLGYREHEFMNASLLNSQFQILEEPKNAIRLNIELPPDELVLLVCEKLDKLRN